MKIQFKHINLIAEDWEKLSKFYEEVFDCRRIPPKRDLKGSWLDEGTGLQHAHLRGIHLRLPGYGEDGPTLEIFQYNSMPKRRQIDANTPGFGHLAFEVEDVAGIAANMVDHGGQPLGSLIKQTIADVGQLTFQYMRDPEGNIIEIQSWEKGVHS